jgi:hypothetical protein
MTSSWVASGAARSAGGDLLDRPHGGTEFGHLGVDDGLDVDLDVAVAVGDGRRLGNSMLSPDLSLPPLAVGSFSRISLTCSE